MKNRINVMAKLEKLVLILFCTEDKRKVIMEIKPMSINRFNVLLEKTVELNLTEMYIELCLSYPDLLEQSIIMDYIGKENYKEDEYNDALIRFNEQSREMYKKILRENKKI